MSGGSKIRVWQLALGVLMIAGAGLDSGALAQPVAEFYRGKSITMLIGYTSGGGYDIYARVLSRHMGRHNMPGAGSLRLANFLYNAAPRDGTTIGMIGRGLAVEPLIGASATQYDGRKFTWLGSGSDQVSLCVTWHTSPVKTWDDMRVRPFRVAGEGSGSDPDMFAIMLKNLMGVRLRIRLSGRRGDEPRNGARRSGRPLWMVVDEHQDHASGLGDGEANQSALADGTAKKCGHPAGAAGDESRD